jgi:RNA polymerase sigma factor (sigma-70 family)
VPHRSAPEADATRRLYEQYARQIYAYCFHQLGNKEEAEDATQSTFLNAFRGLQRGVDPEFETAWLYKIAQNVCLTRQRSSSRRRRVESPGDLDAIQDVLPAREPESDELIGLPEALESMPEQQRRALLLREWQGLSYREIADELGLSQAAVETLLFRARRTLAAGLTESGEQKPGVAKRLVRGGDAGSLIAVVKSILFTGGTKIAATVATVAATSVVAATPAARHVVVAAVDPGLAKPAHVAAKPAVKHKHAPTARRVASAATAAPAAAAVPHVHAVALAAPAASVRAAVHHVRAAALHAARARALTKHLTIRAPSASKSAPVPVPAASAAPAPAAPIDAPVPAATPEPTAPTPAPTPDPTQKSADPPAPTPTVPPNGNAPKNKDREPKSAYVPSPPTVQPMPPTAPASGHDRGHDRHGDHSKQDDTNVPQDVTPPTAAPTPTPTPVTTPVPPVPTPVPPVPAPPSTGGNGNGHGHGRHDQTAPPLTPGPVHPMPAPVTTPPTTTQTTPPPPTTTAQPPVAPTPTPTTPAPPAATPTDPAPVSDPGAGGKWGGHGRKR